MVRVKLFPRELEWCQKHAEKIVEHYGGNNTTGSGSYNHNNIGSNMVGIKSEVATKVWLKRDFSLEDIKCNYEDFTNKRLKGDLNLFGQSLEVKGLRPEQWDKFKRCIPPRQLDAYVRDKAIVIWATAAGDMKDAKVNLKGWNYAHEVKAKGIFRRTICDNIWLKEDDDMRSMETLSDVLKSQ
jgi:hypothetical protein